MKRAIPLRDLWRLCLTTGVMSLGLSSALLAGAPLLKPVFGLCAFLAGTLIPIVFDPLARRADTRARLWIAGAAAAMVWLMVISLPLLIHLARREPAIGILPILGVATLAVYAVDRSRGRAAALMFLAYGVSLLFVFVSQVAGFFLPPLSLLGLFGFLGLAAAGLLMAVWVFEQPRASLRWIASTAALLLGLLTVWTPPRAVATTLERRYLARADLASLAKDFHEYGRITQWRFGDSESWGWLNGRIVATSQSALDSVPEWLGEKSGSLAEALARDSIDPQRLSDLQRRMKRLHFVAAARHGDFARFQRTSRSCGLIFVPRGSPPLSIGDTVPGSRLIVSDTSGFWRFCRAD